ncbi:MAG: HAD family hydrolase [Candidatus Altiarchaeota archaeon]|nr:HAD family hydrolase [Candidatus Altiarchaeota archaeon]
MILVDFSGTLAKHREVVGRLFSEIEFTFFTEKGFTGTEDDLRNAFREVNRKLRAKENKQGDFTMMAGEELGLDITSEDAISKEKMFDEKYAQTIEPLDGALEGLRKLLEVDDLVLLTNGACRRVIPAVEQLGFEGFFKQIICLGGTGQNKSQGELFEKMRKMGAWAIIGDNPRKDGMSEKYNITFVDVRVGWGTTVSLVKGLTEEKLRLRG